LVSDTFSSGFNSLQANLKSRIENTKTGLRERASQCLKWEPDCFPDAFFIYCLMVKYNRRE
jgi:hypothetical protein